MNPKYTFEPKTKIDGKLSDYLINKIQMNQP